MHFLSLREESVIITAQIHKLDTVQITYGLWEIRKDVVSYLFQNGVPNTTGSATRRICADKHVSNTFLEFVGLPVLPIMECTDDTFGESIAFLQKHTCVVVKPANGSKGEGITTNVSTESELRSAYAFAKDSKETAVLLQKQFFASDYRLLVIGKKKVFGIKRIPPFVSGDGVHTIQELVERENARRTNHKGLNPIAVSEDSIHFLHTQQKNMQTVLEDGIRQPLSCIANMSQGGITEDVTEFVHNDIKKQVIQLAQRLDTDVLGIDILSNDIAQNKEYYYLELNSAPGFFLHEHPIKGNAHYPAEYLLSYLFDFPLISV